MGYGGVRYGGVGPGGVDGLAEGGLESVAFPRVDALGRGVAGRAVSSGCGRPATLR